MSIRLDPQRAADAVRAYNEGRYRGRTNLEVDQLAFDRFRSGLPENEEALIDAIRFVGEDYGGAQRRFLPHGYREEAALIAQKLQPIASRWSAAARSTPSIAVAAPSEASLAYFLAPFAGTKRWPVWATKTLHFTQPAAFPVLDSRAKKALGMTNAGGTAKDYRMFCVACRETIHDNEEAMAAARQADRETSPSELKLLDKILYELGG